MRHFMVGSSRYSGRIESGNGLSLVQHQIIAQKQLLWTRWLYIPSLMKTNTHQLYEDYKFAVIYAISINDKT